MINTSVEYILCSAIWFDDGKEYNHQPRNIKTGIVVCGRRHHNIFAIIGGTTKERQDLYLMFEKEQGFLTSLDRFVDRTEGQKIATASGQTTKNKVELYSEDMY